MLFEAKFATRYNGFSTRRFPDGPEPLVGAVISDGATDVAYKHPGKCTTIDPSPEVTAA